MKQNCSSQSARPASQVSRREFLAASSATLVAANLGATKSIAADATKLAINGGQKAVKTACKRARRWGDLERERLNAMLEQDSLFYWKGPQTTLALERYKKIYPFKYAHTCTSGTAAIHIAVNAAGVGPGDEVITSPITDIGTVIGVIYQQGVPVFADLGASTYNLDPADVERRITPKTKAIIAVHLCGNPCDMNALKDIADKHKLILIEDCCQAWGAKYHGQPIGTLGHIGCWSLQDSKHITTGDGGVVASNDERFGPILQMCGDKGANRGKATGGFRTFATNYRMNESSAAVLAAQLERLEGIASKRAKLGNLLTEKITGIPGIAPHQVHPEDRCVYWFYFFRMDPKAFKCDRAKFVQALAAEGVSCSAGYIKVPLHREPVFQNHGFFAGRWPVKEFGLTQMDFTKHHTPEVEAILETGIRVTIHEGMTEDYIVECGAAVRKVAQHFKA
jgi:dTDP-4-amino-4,6-dideoxygalactose transaminase